MSAAEPVRELDPASREILRRGLERAAARRQRHEQEHPEFAHFWAFVEAVRDSLTEGTHPRKESGR